MSEGAPEDDLGLQITDESGVVVSQGPDGDNMDDDGTGAVHADQLVSNEEISFFSAQQHAEFVQPTTDKLILEQDRFLPIANVSRIMKRQIPTTGKIAKDAKECCQECVSEFIAFVTSEASERCQVEKRKTINGEDILFALQTLGFDSYIEPLKIYLAKFRDALKGDKIGVAGEIIPGEESKEEQTIQLVQQGGAIQLQVQGGQGGAKVQNLPIMYLESGQQVVPVSTPSGGIQLVALQQGPNANLAENLHESNNEER